MFSRAPRCRGREEGRHPTFSVFFKLKDCDPLWTPGSLRVKRTVRVTSFVETLIVAIYLYIIHMQFDAILARLGVVEGRYIHADIEETNTYFSVSDICL